VNCAENWPGKPDQRLVQIMNTSGTTVRTTIASAIVPSRTRLVVKP
jgi:hypothetical protein